MTADRPFDVTMELEGWALFWAHLTVGQDSGGLASLRSEVVERVRRRFADTSAVSSDPAVSALRTLFRAAGCDPTRYRPSSEALLRRLAKGAELPQIHPLVDLNNCLSAEIAVPCCVMRDGSFGRELVFRSGRAGESYESLRGPFNLEGKPLLVDEHGPLDAPITGSERVKVLPDTASAWLVAYLPQEVVTSEEAATALKNLAPDAGVLAQLIS